MHSHYGGRTMYVLEYDFHIYTIYMECKKIEHKKEYYDKVEDLIKAYRKKKDAMFMGIPYNDNFKVFKAVLEEIDLNSINSLL